MEPRSHILLILLSLLSSYILSSSSLSTPPPIHISPKKSPSHSSPASTPSSSPSSSLSTPPPIHISPTKSPSHSSPVSTPSSSPSPSSTLDPKQLTALQSLNIPTSKDPCSQPSLHNSTLCDNSKPFRHLISLRLINCSDDVEISSTAIKALTTLKDLQFLNCHISPVKFPPELIANLHSFTCIKSFHKLTGVWLSHLQNLTDLTVSGVAISASGPSIILGSMKKLRSVTISHSNLTGYLPKRWHLNITHIDFSGNQLKGKVPGSLTHLMDLDFLNLSSNALSGELPSSMGDLLSLRNVSFGSNSFSGPIPDTMAEIPGLVHLDLSSNQFNGTIPKFLSKMKDLVHLDLENNNFMGVLPFNGSVIKRFVVFKVGGNSNLCYNHSIVSSKLKLGIARCDKDGLPVSPPPDSSSESSNSGDISSDDSDDSSSDEVKPKSNSQHGPSKVVLGVAIALSSIVFLIVFLVLLSKWCG